MDQISMSFGPNFGHQQNGEENLNST